ncbi:MAG: hypothetical protein GXP16_13000, partial [Gammaproteobacteria bacterium]|nr:hypothetical protein [Gammaproteobacteria bacterium]
MMRFPPQVIYRLLLPGILVFTMSCSLIFEAASSAESDANLKFAGCRTYDDPATNGGDFWIRLNPQMPNDDAERPFVLTGCIATRRPNSNLVAYVTLSGSVVEDNLDQAILMARDREGGAGSTLQSIVAQLVPGPDGVVDEPNPLIRFSSSHDPFNIDEPLSLAPVQCTCASLEALFEGPQQVAPPSSAGGIVAAVANMQNFPEQLALADYSRIAAPRRDPRFFGRYCQLDPVEVCKRVRVKLLGVGLFNKTVCRDITNTTVSIDHLDGRLNGSLFGLGGFKLGKQSSSMAISGTVVGRGIASVSLQLPGPDNRSEGLNNARLTSMMIPGRGIDHRLTIDAYDQTLVLGKQACGNRVPQVTIASASGSNLNWGHNHCFTGTVTQDDDSAFPRSRLTIASSIDG